MKNIILIIVASFVVAGIAVIALEGCAHASRPAVGWVSQHVSEQDAINNKHAVTVNP